VKERKEMVRKGEIGEREEKGERERRKLTGDGSRE
jgi:hypothetical protein